jgi:DNA-binding LytR/AlgR family response regulator
MSRYTVVIAEDESLTRERIVRLLGKYSDFDLVAEASDGREALKQIEANKPDVILLDVNMPALNAFDVLAKLSPADYGILVFITAYDQYAVNAFEHEAFDYLLKPFDDARFAKLMHRLQTRLEENSTPEPQYVLAKDDDTIVKILTTEILYVRAENNYVRIYLADRDYRKRTSIQLMLDELKSPFKRIHRSHLINANEIVKMKHLYQGDYQFTMSNGKTLLSSSSYRDVVKSLTK